MSTRARLATLALVAAGCGVGALVGFSVYVNEFSETGRAFGEVVLALSWVCALGAVGAALALAAMLALAAVGRVRSHA